MQRLTANRGLRTKPVWHLAAAGLLALGLVSTAWADWTQGAKGSWKFAILGDHRGDNKAFLVIENPDGTKTTNGYTDGGITKAVLTNLAQALKAEGVEFALDVGDLVTKWQSTINGTDADTLMSEELGEWRAIWVENSGALPIFPVRGNQEWSASVSMWTNYLRTLPGIGSLPLLSPPGEEGLTYAFTHKNCLFVAVDTYAAAISADSPTLTPTTLEWLGGLFAVSDRPHVFVYGHAPAYEVWDSKKTDFTKVPPVKVMKDGLPSPSAVDPVTGKVLEAVMSYDAVMNVRNPFWNLLGSEKGTYFCGHDHLYARGVAADAAGNMVRQVIIGNGGAPPAGAFPVKVFADDPFVESIAGAAPDSSRYVDNFNAPRIRTEVFDNLNAAGKPPGKYGYIVVEIHGSRATATYKAETTGDDPNGFQELDKWTWKISTADEE